MLKDQDLPQGIIESRLARDIQKETELLHSRLRDIAQAVINDDQLFSNQLEDKLNSTTCLSPRSRSPVRRQLGSRPGSRTGSPFADATFSAVQAALNKRQLQVCEQYQSILFSYQLMILYSFK